MALDYASLQLTASNLLASAGRAVKIKRITEGTYNTATGSASVQESSFTATGVRLDYATREKDGERIKESDFRLLIQGNASKAPRPGDAVELDGITYRIVNVSTLRPAGITLLYDCQVRV